jgi:hypothetical protein
MTAHTAIRSLSTEKNSDGSDFISMDISTAILARLRFQLDVINGNRTAVTAGGSGVLSQLICLETQMSLAELDKCRNGVDPQFRPLFDERYAFGVLRLVLASKTPNLEKNYASAIANALPRMVPEDFLSRLDLAPEIKLFGYLNSYGDVEQALARIGEEYSEMNFRSL